MAKSSLISPKSVQSHFPLPIHNPALFHLFFSSLSAARGRCWRSHSCKPGPKKALISCEHNPRLFKGCKATRRPLQKASRREEKSSLHCLRCCAGEAAPPPTHCHPPDDSWGGDSAFWQSWGLTFPLLAAILLPTLSSLLKFLLLKRKQTPLTFLQERREYFQGNEPQKNFNSSLKIAWPKGEAPPLHLNWCGNALTCRA